MDDHFSRSAGGEAGPGRSWERAVVAALLMVQAASYIPALSGDFKLNQFNPYDSAAYSCLGRSLAQGRGYTTRQEHDAFVPHKTWPPGLPLIIAATMLPSDSMWGAHLAVALMAMASTLLMWSLARRRLRPSLAIVATAAMALSPIYDQLATVTLAEQPALLMVLLSAWCFERWRDSAYGVNGWAAGLAAVVGFGLLVKPLWVPLLLAFTLAAALEAGSAVPLRRRLLRTAAVLGAGVLPWMLWLVRCHYVQAPGYDGYGQIEVILTADKVGGPFVGVGHIARSAVDILKWHVPGRVLDLAAGAGWFLKTRAGVEPGPLASVGILAAFAACWAYAAVRLPRLRLIVLAVALLPVPMLVHPAGGSARYWLHWTPFGLILVLAVVQDLLDRRPCRSLPSAIRAAAVVACLVAMLAIFAADRVGRPMQGRALWASFHDIASRARQLTPPDALVLSPFPTGTSLLSGRAVDATPADLAALAGGGGPPRPVYEIVLINRQDETTLKGPYIEDLPGGSREVVGNAHFRLYRIEPAGR